MTAISAIYPIGRHELTGDASLGAGTPNEPGAFEQVLRAHATRQRASLRRSGGAERADAHRAFEAFVMQNMLGAMMPDETTKLFGTGSAGRMWKSILVEKIADQIARSGRVRLVSDSAFGSPPADAPANGAVNVQQLHGNPVTIERNGVSGWEVALQLPPEEALAAASPPASAVSAQNAVVDNWQAVVTLEPT
ncbi:MAG: hypothetical protein KDJ47_02620 [Hyphomicrobiaceae bacterium]|nr:hypothetical protein [Hyphomicrobiaceae bacterium]